MLRNSECKLAVSDGGLQDNQGLAFRGMNLLEGNVEGLVIYDRVICSDTGKAKLIEGGETMLIYDLVPFLIEAGALAPEHHHPNVAGRILICRFLHTR